MSNHLMMTAEYILFGFNLMSGYHMLSYV